jgi:DNA-binding transcriptional ArsR family regulator
MLSILPKRTDEELDLLFGALADSTRRAIIEQLASGEATVTELAAPFSISLPAVSRHLKVLERASMITRTRHGRWRGARLSPTGLSDAASWLAAQERRWAGRLDRLDDHLAQRTSKPSTSPTESGGP